MDSQIEEIKNKLNVLDVVGSYVKLSKTGVNYRGICPFHSEKGPSFFVNPGRQMWKCFGCGKGGDIFEFIKEIEGVEFGDALKILANKAGVQLKRENPELRTERQRLYEICELACSFFEKQLEGSEWGKKAKDYLLKRGIADASIKKWRLGYSPDTWQGLSDFLVGRGYKREEIVRAGLAVQSEKSNNPYDRFRGRIIFPIFDLNSHPIGFGARIFKEADKKETAKYINTPQTLLYDKSHTLYGMNFAKVSIRKNDKCVLTEGYTDVIMCHQAGFDNTVAVSGTALTSSRGEGDFRDHLSILKRYTNNLILSFDMDLAGSNATNRSIDLAIAQDFNIKIIDIYSGAKDPAEIILEDPKIWEAAVGNARDVMEFYFDFALSHFDKNDTQGRREIQNFIFPKFDLISTNTEKNKQRQRLAKEFAVSEGDILQDFEKWKSQNHRPGFVKNNMRQAAPVSQPDKNFTVQGRKNLLEDRILNLIFKNPRIFNLINASDYCLFSEPSRKFLETLNIASSSIFASEEAGTEEKLKSVFADVSQEEEFKDFFGTLFLRAELEPENEDTENDGPVELERCLVELKKIQLKNELGRLSGVIKNEQDREGECLKEFDKKAKELHFKQN
jgi:DNA primase